MSKCNHCKQDMVEIGRNAYYVFYKCGCHKHEGVEWDWRHLLHNGKEYLLGDAGSIVLECPQCHQEQFRRIVYGHETCLYCPGMIPVKMMEYSH